MEVSASSGQTFLKSSTEPIPLHHMIMWQIFTILGLLSLSPEFLTTLSLRPAPKAPKTLVHTINNIQHREEARVISTMVDIVGGEKGRGDSEVGVEGVWIRSSIKWPPGDTSLTPSSSQTMQGEDLGSSRAV